MAHSPKLKLGKSSTPEYARIIQNPRGMRSHARSPNANDIQRRKRQHQRWWRYRGTQTSNEYGPSISVAPWFKVQPFRNDKQLQRHDKVDYPSRRRQLRQHPWHKFMQRTSYAMPLENRESPMKFWQSLWRHRPALKRATKMPAKLWITANQDMHPGGQESVVLPRPASQLEVEYRTGFVWKCCVPLNPMVNDHYPY